MKHLFSRSLILFASTLVSLFIATQSAWGATLLINSDNVKTADIKTTADLKLYDYSDDIKKENLCLFSKETEYTFTNSKNYTIQSITFVGVRADNNNKEETITISDGKTTATGKTTWNNRKSTTLTTLAIDLSKLSIGNTFTIETTYGLALRFTITYTASSSSSSTYTITYNTDGGEAIAQVTNATALPNPLPRPTKLGYDFAGWYTDEALTIHAEAGAPISDNTTLYANWTPTIYNITYEGLEGATNSGNNPATYTIESETITFVAPGERAGYTFAGWSPASIAKGSTDNQTITAQWTPVEYTITYAGLGGATNSGNNPATYTIETSDITFVAPGERAGYTFAGWSPASIAKGSTDNKTVTAQWKKAHTITFNANGEGATCEPASATCADGESVSLPTPTRDGFTCTGWYDDAIGGNRIAEANATEYTPTKDIILYAQWEVAPACETMTIFDGSTSPSSAPAAGASGSAANGASWSLTGNATNEDDIDYSYNEISYSKGWKFSGGETTGSNRYAKIVIPEGYTGRVEVVSYVTSGSRSIFISKDNPTGTLDKTYGYITYSETKKLYGIEPELQAGTYYLCATNSVYIAKFSVEVCSVCTTPTMPLAIEASAAEIYVNASATISVKSGTGNSGAVTYTVSPATGSINQASGEFTATAAGDYTITATQAANGGFCGGTATTTIKVNPLPACEPNITTQPTEQKVVLGNDATLTVVASGSGTLTYHWYTCQSDGSNPQPISGATKATYTVTPDAPGTTYYKVVVTGDCGTATSEVVSITASKECGELIRATLTGANTANVIGILAGSAEVSVSNSDGTTEGYKLGSNKNYIAVSLKSGYTFKENDTVVINVTATSSFLRIYSDKGETLLVESSSVTTGENRLVLPAEAEGVSTLYLYRTDSKMNPYVSYMAVRRDCCPEKKPVLTAADNTTLCGTGNVVFTATDFTAGATLNLYQVGNATPLQTVSTTDETSVTFTAVEVNTTTKYYVVATKDCDKSSDTVTVTVNTLPTTASLVDPDGSPIYVGDSRTFEVTTNGEGCTYQWLRDGVAISGATGKTYEFTAEMSDVNTYSNFSCRVTGCDGTTEFTTPEVVVTVKLENCYYITENKTLSATKGYDFGDFVLYIANKDNKYETSTSGICGSAKYRYYASSVVIELKTVGVSAIRLFGQHTANRSVSKVEVSDALNGTYTEVLPSEYTKVDYTYSSETPCGELGISDKNFLAGDFVRLTFGGEEFRISGLCVTGLNCSTPDLMYYPTEVEVPWADRENPSLPLLTNATNGVGVPVTYSSSNEKVATVDANGKVKLIGVGTANIIASFEGDGEYCPKNAVYSVTVTCPDDVPQIAVDGTVDLANCNDAILLKLQDSHGEDISSGNIQWYRNGLVLPGATAPTYTATVAGTYTATLTKTCELLTSNSAVVTSSVPQPIVTPVVPKRFFQISNRSVRPYEATTHYPLFDVTPKATAEYKGDKWVASYTIHHAGTVTVGTAPINWLREDATGSTISIGANYELLSTWLSTNGFDEENVGDTIMLTMRAVNACDQPDDATADSIPIILTDKYSLAYIVTGNTTTRKFYDITKSDIADPLYTQLRTKYNVTPVSAYATYDYTNYEPYDLLLLTDYPKATGTNAQPDYVNALADLVDKKPILSLKAHMSALSNWSAKGFTSNPVVPGDGSEEQAQKTLTVLCFSHDMFAEAQWDNEALRTLTILSDVYQDGSTYKGIQGFTAINSSNFVNIATVYDKKGDRNLVACCERQDVTKARFIMLSINQGATKYINPAGQDAIDKLLKYLLWTEATKVSDCSLTFDNGEGAEGPRTVTIGETPHQSGDHQWNNPANWNAKAIPTQLQNVRIEANCIVSGNTYGAGNVRIKKGNTLTIAPNGGLASVGKFAYYIDNNWNQPQPITDTKYITVQANEDKTGMLMHSHTDALAATVEMYSPARYDGTLTNGQERIWSYVAIPVQEGTVPQIFNGAYTYLWSEKEGWIRYNDGRTFRAFDGIALSQPSPKTFTFAGNLALAQKYEFTLTNTENSPMQGMNLIGNSWTAPIQITKLEDTDFGTGLEATVYIYSTGRDPESGPATTETEGALEEGHWTAIPIKAAKGTGWKGPKIIPAMQAFEVNFATDATSATLTLDYNTIVRASGVDYSTLNQKLYAPGRNSTAEILQPDPSAPAPYEPTMLRIRVADTAACYNLHLLQGERFSEGFDNGWDGFYTGTDGRAPGLCALTTAGEMQVSAQPEIDNTTLVFTPGRSNTYTFSFCLTETEDEPLDAPLYLNDMQLRKSCLIDDSRTYTFQSSENDMENRFVISHIAFEEQDTPTGIANLATVDQQLMLSNPAREALTIRVYDPAGRLCSEMSTREAMLQITLPEPQGVYMIHITGEHTEILRKIVQ